MKKFINFITFWLVIVPLWIPQRIIWKIKRNKCKRKGCCIKSLKDKESGKILYNWCSRCHAYEGLRGYADKSEYSIIEV